jgi:pimeloyl-ACP methyl ester carboxylesterase
MMQDWWQATFPKGRQTLTISDAHGFPIKIAYGEKGSGKPIVLVHGIGSWSYGWRYLIEPLAQHFRVICFDATGHGFSEKPLQAEITHQGRELKQVIQALCEEPAAIVAQSLGALATLAMATEDQSLLTRLVLINVPIFPEQLPSVGMRVLSGVPLHLVQNFDQLRLVRLMVPLVRGVVGLARQEVVANPADITQEDVYWVTYPYIEQPGAIAGFAQSLQQAAREIQRLEQKQPNLISKVQDNLGSITSPTLILWGERDGWFPVSHGEKLHTCLPNSRLEILPDCGHDAAGSFSKQVYAAVLPFLQELPVEQ